MVKQNEKNIMKTTKEGYYTKHEIVTEIFWKKKKIKIGRSSFRNMSDKDKQKLKEYGKIYRNLTKMLL